MHTHVAPHTGPSPIAKVINRGVATGWTGVDMSIPLLPEGVPEIDAEPLSVGGHCRVEVGKARSVLLRLSLSTRKWSSADLLEFWISI